VGFIVVQWGHCEQSLELLTNVLFQYFGGKNLARSKRMPKQLAAKLDFVKACASTVPALAPFKDDLLAVVEEFAQLTQIRHDIVHGALTDTSPLGSVFQFIRLQTHPDTHEVMPFLYDLNVFPKLRKRLIDLGAAAPRMAKRVFEARPTV
jgi:hypothetical protein